MRASASNNEIPDFKFIASCLNIYVIMVNIKIPATNDMNLPGQNCPPNPETAYLVASINVHVIGMPNNININL